MPRICLDFDERKATEATAVLLKLSPEKRLPYLSVMKLLYFAERESFQRLECPIIGDLYVSMRHGPVLSQVLNLIKADRDDLGDKDVWLKHLERSEWDLCLIRDPGINELPKAQVAILEAEFRHHGHLTPWQLRDLSHELPEWEDPGESCLPIPPERILQCVGKTDAQIKEIAQELAWSSRVDELLRKSANCVRPPAA